MRTPALSHTCHGHLMRILVKQAGAVCYMQARLAAADATGLQCLPPFPEDCHCRTLHTRAAWQAVEGMTSLPVSAGGVGWGVFGSYAKYTGVLNCSFILLAFFVGQAAYLGSEYWLITWAYRWSAVL